jgi:hypothetical protein
MMLKRASARSVLPSRSAFHPRSARWAGGSIAGAVVRGRVKSSIMVAASELSGVMGDRPQRWRGMARRWRCCSHADGLPCLASRAVLKDVKRRGYEAPVGPPRLLAKQSVEKRTAVSLRPDFVLRTASRGRFTPACAAASE